MSRRRGDHARRLSEHERGELQRRVAEGETFASAAAAVGCSTKSIQRLLARTGGLARRATERSPLRLSPADREELSRGLVAGDSLRHIAERLGRVVSTLSREVERNTKKIDAAKGMPSATERSRLAAVNRGPSRLASTNPGLSDAREGGDAHGSIAHVH
jgi:DNA-binding NarL/FixJ family response regulator